MAKAEYEPECQQVRAMVNPMGTRSGYMAGYPVCFIWYLFCLTTMRLLGGRAIAMYFTTNDNVLMDNNIVEYGCTPPHVYKQQTPASDVLARSREQTKSYVG